MLNEQILLVVGHLEDQEKLVPITPDRVDSRRFTAFPKHIAFDWLSGPDCCPDPVLNDSRHLFLHAAAQDDSNNLPGEVYRRRGGLNGLRPINIVLIACFNYGRPKFTIVRGGHGYFSQSNAV